MRWCSSRARRQLARLNSRQLRLEADCRYGLVHIRDNAEAIAFYRGERQEQRQAQIAVVQQSYDGFSEFLPSLVTAPPCFARRRDFGVFGQAGLAFSQGLAFARLLLNGPAFVVLDEATSALDVTTEKRLYALLVQREMAFVSVGHRPTLKEDHDTVLELNGGGGCRRAAPPLS